MIVAIDCFFDDNVCYQIEKKPDIQGNFTAEEVIMNIKVKIHMHFVHVLSIEGKVSLVFVTLSSIYQDQETSAHLSLPLSW